MKTALGIAIVLVAALVVAIVWYRSRTSPRHMEGSAASVPVQMVDPSKLLFSLATICDRLPSTKPIKVQPASVDLVLPEDDWRQMEFVSLADSAHIRQELVTLRRFKEENKVGMGYRNIYVRKDHPHASHDLGITIEQLRHALPDTTKQGRLFLSSSGNVTEAEGGFAFSLSDGSTIYGHEEKGIIGALGIELGWRATPYDVTAETVVNLGTSMKVFLVDWYWAKDIDLAVMAPVETWLQDHVEYVNRAKALDKGTTASKP